MQTAPRSCRSHRSNGGPERRRAGYVLLALLLLAVLTAAGCGDREAGGSPGPSSTAASTPAAAGEVTAYFPDAGGEHLVAETSPLQAGQDPLAAAAAALAAGPRTAGLGPGLPAGVEVASVRRAGAVAEIDLGEAFARAYPSGGSAAEIALLAPIVYTLTEVPGVRRVRLLAAGRAPESPGASFDLTRPLARSDLPDGLVRAAP